MKGLTRFFVFRKPLARRAVQKEPAGDNEKRRPLVWQECGLATANWNTEGDHSGVNDTNSLSHTKWNCKYHIVFAPKYRRKVFYGEKEERSGKYCENCASGKR